MNTNPPKYPVHPGSRVVLRREEEVDSNHGPGVLLTHTTYADLLQLAVDSLVRDNKLTVTTSQLQRAMHKITGHEPDEQFISLAMDQLKYPSLPTRPAARRNYRIGMTLEA